MMKFVIAAGVIALMAIGFLFVRGPAPAIIVAPEHIFDIGPVAVTNTMFTSWCVVLILCSIFYKAIYWSQNRSLAVPGEGVR